MTGFMSVDPNKFIDPVKGTPPHGRGAWTSAGIGFGYRPAINPPGFPRIGMFCEKSLDAWAVAAGVWAIQQRLAKLGCMPPITDIGSKGVFGPMTQAGVKLFQGKSFDPLDGDALSVDGVVGQSDSRALWTPIIDAAEKKYGIPNHLLRGQVNHESMMDAGSLGYYIYYPDYRGVDRGLCQINSAAQYAITWQQAFDPAFALPWSGANMRANFDTFKAHNPTQKVSVLWDAAVCAHNNPYAAGKWARTGVAPSEAAEDYVLAVKDETY